MFQALQTMPLAIIIIIFQISQISIIQTAYPHGIIKDANATRDNKSSHELDWKIAIRKQIEGIYKNESKDKDLSKKCWIRDIPDPSICSANIFNVNQKFSKVCTSKKDGNCRARLSLKLQKIKGWLTEDIVTDIIMILVFIDVIIVMILYSPSYTYKFNDLINFLDFTSREFYTFITIKNQSVDKKDSNKLTEYELAEKEHPSEKLKAKKSRNYDKLEIILICLIAILFGFILYFFSRLLTIKILTNCTDSKAN